MAAISSSAQSTKPLPKYENIYCSDPNCTYCKELRQAEEEVAKREQTNHVDDAT